MQTQEMKQNSRDILLPVPAELMEEAGLCASDVIQYYATPGKLVIEAIRDPELLQGGLWGCGGSRGRRLRRCPLPGGRHMKLYRILGTRGQGDHPVGLCGKGWFCSQ